MAAGTFVWLLILHDRHAYAVYAHTAPFCCRCERRLALFRELGENKTPAMLLNEQCQVRHRCVGQQRVRPRNSKHIVS